MAAGVFENKKCSFEREIRSKKKRKNPRAGVAAEIKKTRGSREFCDG